MCRVWSFLLLDLIAIFLPSGRLILNSLRQPVLRAKLTLLIWRKWSKRQRNRLSVDWKPPQNLSLNRLKNFQEGPKLATNAFLTAALGVGAAAIASYLFYSQTIGKWYAASRKNSRHSSIKYWCGFVSSATIFQGFSSLFVAALNHLLNDGLLNENTFAKSAVSVIIIPSVLFLLAFLLTKFVPEKLATIGENPPLDDQAPLKPTLQR